MLRAQKKAMLRPCLRCRDRKEIKSNKLARLQNGWVFTRIKIQAECPMKSPMNI